jgi:hypothetical protein
MVRPSAENMLLPASYNSLNRWFLTDDQGAFEVHKSIFRQPIETNKLWKLPEGDEIPPLEELRNQITACKQGL